MSLDKTSQSHVSETTVRRRRSTRISLARFFRFIHVLRSYQSGAMQQLRHVEIAVLFIRSRLISSNLQFCTSDLSCFQL